MLTVADYRLEDYLCSCYTRCVDKSRFDATYFDRYYGRSPVRGASEVYHLATAVHEMLAWWGAHVESVLEVGAGPGDWSNWYRRLHPSTHVTSTDVSEHACRTFGHQRRDISEWRPSRTFDLVICMDVLQYLDDRAAESAMRNLTAATRTCLYFDALTAYDARYTVDRSATDLDACLRTGAWYHERLARGFMHVGAGMWIRKGSSVVLHELERGH